MLFLLASACVQPAPEAEPPAAIIAPVLTFEADPPPDARPYTVAPPSVCADPIYAAQAGNVSTAPALADTHEAVFGAAPTPDQVHLGYIEDPSTSIAILWRTDGDTRASQVQIGLDANYGTTLDGASFYVLGADSTDTREHEVHVCDLPPSTTFHYRVGGEGAWSSDYTFTTAPPAGSPGRVVFGVAGDSRGAPSTWAQVAAGQAAHGAEFRLFTGDAVVMGTKVEYWDDWFDAAEGYLESIPTVMANGNHEGNAQPFFALHAAPGNERYFSLDYGSVHIVALNDTVPTSGEWAAQAEWLAADLAASTQPWKIVFHHKPAYSNCAPNGQDMYVRTYFVPAEEAGGVNVDFAGHNHNYERSVPLVGGVETEGGITYVVTAGAGAPLYDNNQGYSYMLVGQETQHYVIVEADATTFTVTAYDLADNVLDTFTLTK